jgi:hypothetical protein
MIVKSLKVILVTIVACFYSFLAWAQEKKAEVDINVNKDGGGAWYNHPWAWVIGGAIFILLVIALVRGKGSSD